MGEPAGDQALLLRDARANAQRLLAGLIARRDDLDRSADQLATDTRVTGRQAFARAIDAARRTVDGLDRALNTATSS
jgi:hypothetical protein